MSLHNKARKYLFDTFVQRSYEGIEKPLKKQLLETHPDDILDFSNHLRKLTDLIDQGSDLINEIHSSAKKAKEKVYQLLYQSFSMKFLLIFEYPEMNVDKNILSLKWSKGVIPKSIKKWKPNRKLIQFIDSKLKSQEPSVATLSEKERNDYFEEFEGEINIATIADKRKKYAYLIFPSNTEKKVWSLDKTRFAYLCKMASLIHANSHKKNQFSAEKRKADQYFKMFKGTFQEIAATNKLNDSSLDQIKKLSNFERFIVFKLENKTLNAVLASGIQSFQVFSLSLQKNKISTGFADVKIQKEFKAKAPLIKFRSIYVQKVDTKKDVYFFILDAPKKAIKDIKLNGLMTAILLKILK